MGQLIYAEHHFRIKGASYTPYFSAYYNRPLGKDLHQPNAFSHSPLVDVAMVPFVLFYTFRRGHTPEVSQSHDKSQHAPIIPLHAHRRTPPTPAS